MRIALLSDIHANLPALEAVWTHAQKKGCDQVWNLGDSVGYGPFPDATIEFLKDLPGRSIMGNYDQKVLAFPDKKKKWVKSKQPLKYLAFQWAYDHLSKKNHTYLGKLPERFSVEKGVNRFLNTHGSPFSNEEVIQPSTPPDRLQQIAKISKADVVACGHSHLSFAFGFKKWWFLNPGSVGRPGDGDYRASYAVLKIKKKSWSIKHFRLEYDLNRTVNQILEFGLPEEFADMFRHGRSLDDL